ncbi:MAG: hypothetical protein Q7S64_00230 [bacterium]|nr:hypothetical protein [bacterium]
MSAERLTTSEEQPVENDAGFREVEDLDTEAEAATPETTPETTSEEGEFLDELDAELAKLVAQIEAARSVEEVDQIEADTEKRLLSVLFERGEKITFEFMKAHDGLLQVDKWPQPVRAALLMDPPVTSYGDFLARRASQPTLFRRLMIIKDVLVGAAATTWASSVNAIFNAQYRFGAKLEAFGRSLDPESYRGREFFTGSVPPKVSFGSEGEALFSNPDQ